MSFLHIDVSASQARTAFAVLSEVVLQKRSKFQIISLEVPRAVGALIAQTGMCGWNTI